MTRRFSSGTRGVSELVAFVLTFSIIMLAVSLTYMGGFTALTSQQESEQVNAAERAMIALEETFTSIERGEAPARTGEIRLAGGSLAVEESATMGVTVGHENGTWTEDVRTGSLTYQFDDSVVSYENGAVVRRDGDSGMVQVDPSIHCTDDHTIVSLVQIERRGNSTAISSDGSVEVNIEKTDTRLYYPMTENGTLVNDAKAAKNVTLSIETSGHEAEWAQWFESRDEWTAEANGYECDTDALFVRTTKVSVRLFN